MAERQPRRTRATVSYAEKSDDDDGNESDSEEQASSSAAPVSNRRHRRIAADSEDELEIETLADGTTRAVGGRLAAAAAASGRRRSAPPADSDDEYVEAASKRKAPLRPTTGGKGPMRSTTGGKGPMIPPPPSKRARFAPSPTPSESVDDFDMDDASSSKELSLPEESSQIAEMTALMGRHLRIMQSLQATVMNMRTNYVIYPPGEDRQLYDRERARKEFQPGDIVRGTNAAAEGRRGEIFMVFEVREPGTRLNEEHMVNLRVRVIPITALGEPKQAIDPVSGEVQLEYPNAQQGLSEWFSGGTLKLMETYNSKYRRFLFLSRFIENDRIDVARTLASVTDLPSRMDMLRDFMRIGTLETDHMRTYIRLRSRNQPGQSPTWMLLYAPLSTAYPYGEFRDLANKLDLDEELQKAILEWVHFESVHTTAAAAAAGAGSSSHAPYQTIYATAAQLRDVLFILGVTVEGDEDDDDDF